jgi:hypothetical protein
MDTQTAPVIINTMCFASVLGDYSFENVNENLSSRYAEMVIGN